MSTGKVAVVAIFVVAVGMAVFAVLFQAQQDRQLLQAWTGEHLARIGGGESVQLLRFDQGTHLGDIQISEADVVRGGGATMLVDQRRDISDAPGLVHARHVLIQDSSYVWDGEPIDEDEPTWEFAFVFQDESGTTTILLDASRRLACLLERDKWLRTTKMVDRLEKYVTEDLAEDQASTTQQGNVGDRGTDDES